MRLPGIHQLIFCLVIYTVRVSVTSGETCEGFQKQEIRSNCARIIEESPTCHIKYADQDCGMGLELAYFENCTTQTVNCCKPCFRKVIHKPGCSASYCVYGTYPPGQIYREGNCEYISGYWSECHSEILMRKRKDRLRRAAMYSECKYYNFIEKVCSANEISGDSTSPPPYRPSISYTLKPNSAPPINVADLKNASVVIKSSAGACTYSTVSSWSSCHHQTQTRRIVKKLDKDSDHEICEKSKIDTRPCFTKGGKERCFYAKWSRWTRCDNYIQQRQRKILFGKKADCRRTTKIRTCQFDSKSRHSQNKSKKQRNEKKM